ncbi:efflux RND transporter periplasmic adaptor subunit [Rhodohalobacter sp.]|uniref:efflux RND transporter periplasmic adaptor subunit n=1 Tax=Rhodohalobacter sp. TaxID=1974210 RepID=UPI0035635B4C
MNITKTQYLTYASILITGIILGWLFFGGSSTVQNNPEDHEHEQVTNESGEEVWTCSMHPSVREDEPGSCPICGMDLIPASSEESEDDYSMVMTEASMQLADIQTTPAVRERAVREIHLPGRVEIDERRISYVTAHFEGRVRDVKIDFTGAPIRKGEVMATIYSPDLVSAQRELLQAVQVQDRNPQLYEAAVRKFRLWEFSDEQIQAIIDRGEVQTNMEILSPVDGFVMKRNVVDEQHVMEGTVIYEVANLDQLWVTLDAYEEDLPWITEGNEVTFQTRSNPGQDYRATIDFIDPTFNPQKRTIRLRANVENGDHSLRPDMLVSGTVQAEVSEEKILVPTSAVLWTGPRSLVYVKDPSAETPRFEVREVELGVRAGDYYVIEEGLNEGEEVVFNGNFRIDSEFQLADKFSMMNREPGSGAVPTGHQHGDTDMDESEMEEEDHSEHQSETSAEEEGNEVDEAFREEFTQMLEIYLTLKDELIESDLESAVNSAANLIAQLEEIGEHRLEGDSHVAWMESYSAIMDHAESMSNTDDIEEYREAFSLLSDQLIEDVKTFGIEGVVYHQYCPMAFDNEGADWLSRNEQIQNPYLPENMLTCGEVIDRIES